MKLLKSRGSPNRTFSSISTVRSRISGQSDSGMKTREAALHFWPWYS
jgi:hypothetical protein